MTARSRTRTFIIGAATAALLAPLAVLAATSTTASATPSGRPHEVYMYKVEKHIDVTGEFPDNYFAQDVSCNPGDIVLDGMWRIDHVDQANPPDTFGDERDVAITASYGDNVDQTEWHFRGQNHADGDAQIKLFVTCIRGTVEAAYGHTHNVVISSRVTDSSHTALAAGVGEWDHSFTCPSGTVAVTPGFNFTNLGVADDDHVARIFRSWPTSNFRSWHWAFLVTDPNVDVNLYLRCLQTTTGAAGNGPHAHALPFAWRPNGFSGYNTTLDVNGTQERRINCDDGVDGAQYQNYKAVVGAFWINDPIHVWFLGQDPRPKQRASKFWWDTTGDPNVYLGALCVRARTGKQIHP